MNRKYSYFILAVTFLSFLLIVFFFIGKTEAEPITEDIKVETPPFQSYISATGIVEPKSGNIDITSPLNRIVEKIYVSVNDQVKKGDTLFQISNQDFLAQPTAKQKEYEKNLSNLQKLEALPRKGDLTIAQENLNKVEAAFNESMLEYCLAKNKQARYMLLYKYQQAEAEFLKAQAEFEKVRLGTWEYDLQMAKDEADEAAANTEAVKAEIAETYIKSPIDGTVLQLKIHEGEIADPSKTAAIIGNIGELNLRVSIDQFNETRFNPDCRAVAYKQGDISTEYPLKFIHYEPVMIPKKYLTNELEEKVDTQVFELLYRIEKTGSRLFIGEQMDVYIYVDQS